ncbi:prepilin-type cleavage/methylation domain-containing protein [Dyella solisilvae]|uniref:Prepilin-type cleavage/methylation domain-containing protein n=2 Tax=Dyella solisilvae TaxID=1920168 RepID=A0A370KBN9_9GAMM|nr:prepilin-type cleavage/methylation domain-containing protein [Dyella solisilvae]
MVAMLLGLIVIGGVMSVFLAGQQTYRANEALSDVESGSRTAFEMLTRDLRDVGFTGCDNTSGRVANVLNSSATLWYANWAVPLQGYDDASTDPALSSLTGFGAPVAGMSSVSVLGTALSDVTVGTASGSPTSFNINAASTQLAAGDIIMVCDFDHATLLQIATYSGTSVGFTSATTPAPGNCSTGLGYPTICTSTGNAYTFLPNARINLMTAVDWYIGKNPVGGYSLYRLPVTYSAAGVAVTTPQEMVRNVTSMKIFYLQSGGTVFSNATTVAGNWAAVNAAQVTFTLQSTNARASVNNAAPLVRQFTSTTTMRNRVL